MSINIRRLSTQDESFKDELDALLAWDSVSDLDVQQTVSNIVFDVRKRGNDALLEYTNQFDRCQFTSAEQLEVPVSDIQAAMARVDASILSALESAAERVRSYHLHQKHKQACHQSL